MLNFFKRNKVKINAISIPKLGWNEVKNDKQIKQWINPEQTVALSVNFFDKQPDLPTIKDIDKLRGFYRNQIITHKGGLIEVEKINIKGFDVIRTIFKIPQDPSGMTYIASLTIPFDKYSFVVKIQAPEVDVSGVRDNVLAMKLLNEGKISKGENGYIGWFCDPYKSDFKEGYLMNKSEEVKYDADFPIHPLTIARKLLANIESEMEFGNELEKIGTFEK